MEAWARFAFTLFSSCFRTPPPIDLYLERCVADARAGPVGRLRLSRFIFYAWFRLVRADQRRRASGAYRAYKRVQCWRDDALLRQIVRARRQRMLDKWYTEVCFLRWWRSLGATNRQPRPLCEPPSPA